MIAVSYQRRAPMGRASRDIRPLNYHHISKCLPNFTFTSSTHFNYFAPTLYATPLPAISLKARRHGRAAICVRESKRKHSGILMRAMMPVCRITLSSRDISGTYTDIRHTLRALSYGPGYRREMCDADLFCAECFRIETCNELMNIMISIQQAPANARAFWPP